MGHGVAPLAGGGLEFARHILLADTLCPDGMKKLKRSLGGGLKNFY